MNAKNKKLLNDQLKQFGIDLDKPLSDYQNWQDKTIKLIGHLDRLHVLVSLERCYQQLVGQIQTAIRKEQQ